MNTERMELRMLHHLSEMHVEAKARGDDASAEYIKALAEIITQHRRLMGARSRGGLNRAANLTPSRRSQIASNAAKARWQRHALTKGAI